MIGPGGTIISAPCWLLHQPSLLAISVANALASGNLWQQPLSQQRAQTPLASYDRLAVVLHVHT